MTLLLDKILMCRGLRDAVRIHESERGGATLCGFVSYPLWRGYRPGSRLPRAPTLRTQLAASKILASTLQSNARCVRCAARVRAAVATRGQPYARVDVLSDALGSDGSVTNDTQQCHEVGPLVRRHGSG